MLTKIKNLFTGKTQTTDQAEVSSDQIAPAVIKNEDESEKKIEVAVDKDNQVKENGITQSEKVVEVSVHSEDEIREEVIKVLKTCYDPEIPVDVWELGLIYEIKVATNGDVLIVMTLTSPSCPVAGILPGEIEQKVKDHPMIHDCKVQLTFDPPWSQTMMSEVAKLELGFL